MKNNNTDIFEINKNQYSNQRASNNNLDASNFFLTTEAPVIKVPKRPVADSNRRLNDYDFNLLKEDAYKDVTDDVFKLEYKISKIEDEIKSLEYQIQAARDIDDLNLINELVERKKVLEEDFEALIALYNDKSISARITEGVSSLLGSKIKKKINDLKTKATDFTESLMLKMPGHFSSLVELKKSLSKLENINRSVDELMALNLPYGENINKYEQLSKFIIKANSIQSEINQYMRNK
ncbi:MAG: hypothetical protein E7Z92_07250 [Cyanobacteria bacterium SIG31]|nr:hypothetical protein [Cyanobacteria bacterium SIG31]